MKQGLNHKELKQFSDLLIKANYEQLQHMSLQINKEAFKRATNEI